MVSRKPSTLSLSLSLLQHEQSSSHPHPVESDDIVQLHQRYSAILRSGHKYEEEWDRPRCLLWCTELQTTYNIACEKI
jgi:hypothetical protein